MNYKQAQAAYANGELTLLQVCELINANSWDYFTFEGESVYLLAEPEGIFLCNVADDSIVQFVCDSWWKDETYPTEHKNQHFNIIQETRTTWSVIQGQRADGGYPVRGAITLATGLTRNDAIKVANKLQASFNTIRSN